VGKNGKIHIEVRSPSGLVVQNKKLKENIIMNNYEVGKIIESIRGKMAGREENISQVLLTWIQDPKADRHIFDAIKDSLSRLVRKYEKKNDGTDSCISRDIHKAMVILANILGWQERGMVTEQDKLSYNHWVDEWEHIEKCWLAGHSQY
jgi:hypothetical protein